MAADGWSHWVREGRQDPAGRLARYRPGQGPVALAWGRHGLTCGTGGQGQAAGAVPPGRQAHMKRVVLGRGEGRNQLFVDQDPLVQRARLPGPPLSSAPSAWTTPALSPWAGRRRPPGSPCRQDRQPTASTAGEPFPAARGSSPQGATPGRLTGRPSAKKSSSRPFCASHPSGPADARRPSPATCAGLTSALTAR